MAINDDIDRQLGDWISFDEMIAQVAAANEVDAPRLQHWLHMKQFCCLRPLRFWHPHIEYQQFYPNARGRLFVEGAVLVEFLLGSDCFPDESMLWALKNGGVVFWQKSVVSQWLLMQDASVPESWLTAGEKHSPVKSSEPIKEFWVTKAEILEHKWPLPPGEKVPWMPSGARNGFRSCTRRWPIR